jgi:hypothetical protein
MSRRRNPATPTSTTLLWVLGGGVVVYLAYRAYGASASAAALPTGTTPRATPPTNAPRRVPPRLVPPPPSGSFAPPPPSAPPAPSTRTTYAALASGACRVIAMDGHAVHASPAGDVEPRAFIVAGDMIDVDAKAFVGGDVWFRGAVPVRAGAGTVGRASTETLRRWFAPLPAELAQCEPVPPDALA